MMHRRWYLVAVLPLAVGCVSRSTHQELNDKYAQANQRIRELEALAQGSAEDADRFRQEAASASSLANQRNQQLASERSQNAQTIAQLRAELENLQRDPGNKIDDVLTRFENGTFIYEIKGDVLFDSGKAELKSSARNTLNQVAEQLRKNNYTIEVAGHTDSDPVVKTKDKYPRGNIELGAERALSVLSELKAAGVPEDRLMLSSYGEFKPRGAEKSQNRRVEIRVRVSEPKA